MFGFYDHWIGHNPAFKRWNQPQDVTGERICTRGFLRRTNLKTNVISGTLNRVLWSWAKASKYYEVPEVSILI